MSSPTSQNRFSRPRTRDDSYSPEYNEKHPNFPYSALHAPPPEWELYDIPDKTHLRNRALDLATFKKLVRHHTWGFDVVIGDRKTKDRLLQVLKRIVYNQEASLRPTWHQFVSRNCDAGPRLLRRSYDALRISRKFPDGVPGQPLRWAGVMPKDVPSPKGRGIDNGSGQRSGFGFGCQGYAVNSMHQPYLVDATSNGNGLYRGPPYSSTLNTIQTQAYMYDQHEHIASPIPPTILNPNPHPTPMSICLPTPPTLTTQLPPTNPPLCLSISGEIPHFTPSPAGTLYPTHGRGPVSLSAPSDPVSCAIVAGLLLRLAPPPTFPHQPSPLTSIESAFLTALSIPWSTLPDSTSVARLDEFRGLCREYVDAVNKALNPLAAINGDKTFIPLSPSNVWTICTSSLPGVQVRFAEGVRGCVCQGQKVEKDGSKLITNPFITPDAYDGTGQPVDLDSSIRRFFAFERRVKCRKCCVDNSIVLTRTFERVPLHLAIRPDPRVLFERHSSDLIEVEYVNATDNLHRARYRWVGGMYPIATPTQQQPKYMIFWADRDSSPGAMDTGMLRVYDAMQLSGTIVGGVRLPVFGLGERVPTKWWATCAAKGSSPMLFYEKVEDTGTQAVWGLDLGLGLEQNPIQAQSQSQSQQFNQGMTANVLRENPNPGLSTYPVLNQRQHLPRIGGLQSSGNMNINPNIHLSPAPCPWNSSSGEVDSKYDISSTHFSSASGSGNRSGNGSGVDSDVFENILSTSTQLESSSPTVAVAHGNNGNGNVVSWVPHSAPQLSSSNSNITDDSGMFMDIDLNMDMDMGIDGTNLGSLDFDSASGGGDIIPSYPALSEVTPSSNILTAATTTGPTHSSIPSTLREPLIVDPQLANPQTAPSTTANTTATSTSVTSDITWDLNFPSTNSNPNYHPTPANMESVTTPPSAAIASAPTLPPLTPSYNAFDASLNAFGYTEPSLPTDPKPNTNSNSNTAPNLIPIPNPSAAAPAPDTVERTYLPPHSLTLSRKRNMPRSPSAGTLAEGGKRVKM